MGKGKKKKNTLEKQQRWACKQTLSYTQPSSCPETTLNQSATSAEPPLI